MPKLEGRCISNELGCHYWLTTVKIEWNANLLSPSFAEDDLHACISYALNGLPVFYVND